MKSLVPLSTITLLRLAVLAAGFGLLTASSSAGAVTVLINNATVSWGSGYGVDESEQESKDSSDSKDSKASKSSKDAKDSKATLLDVSFQHSFKSGSFSFENPGDAFVIQIASVTLGEVDDHGGITDDEINDLDVWWTFSLDDVPAISMHADAFAFTGSISDKAIDYALHWAPVDVDLGSLGLFRVSLNNLEFSERGSMSQKATITFLSPSLVVPEPGYRVPDPSLSVPEPGSMALIALGLAGIGATRRKKMCAA